MIEIRIYYKVISGDDVTFIYRMDEKDFVDLILKHLQLDEPVRSLFINKFEKLEIKKI